MKKLYIYTFDNSGEKDFDYFVADDSLHTAELKLEAYKQLHGNFGLDTLDETIKLFEVLEVYPVDTYGKYKIVVQ